MDKRCCMFDCVDDRTCATNVVWKSHEYEVGMRGYASTTPIKDDRTFERRKSLRVCPPSMLIKEIALWFMPPCKEPTLGLAELGVPHLLSMHGEHKISVCDISSVGIRLSIDKDVFPPTSAVKSGHCYIYLKLLTPLPGKNTLHCLLLGIRLLGLASNEKSVQLRGQIVVRARPAGASKSFSLFKVDRVGIKEISVWCDEISRMGRGILPPVTTCLNMENLLMEVFLQQSGTEQLSTP